MALTITKKNAYQRWRVTSPVEPIPYGDALVNGSRTGTGVLCSYSRASFGLGIVEQVKFLVYSGTFVSGDSITSGSGGSFTLNTNVANTTEETIIVKGTMADNSDSALSSAVDDSTITIPVTTATASNYGRIMRVDSEYMQILFVGTGQYIVKRGMLGSTPASHSSSAVNYIVDDDLYQSIYNADVSNGWGLVTDVNGEFDLDCHLMRGECDQTAVSILLSASEKHTLQTSTTNHCFGLANSSYATHYMEGLGHIDEGTRVFTGFNTKGCVAKYNAADAGTFHTGGAGGYYNIPNHIHYAFDTNMEGVPETFGAVFWKNINIYGGWYISQASGESSKAKNITISGKPVNFISGEVEISKLTSNYTNPAIYWVQSRADAEVWELTATDGYQDEGGFISSGKKTLINCGFLMGSGIFWGEPTEFSNCKTVDACVVDETGNALEDVQVKCEYVVENPSVLFTENTDSNGDITQQIAQFAYVKSENFPSWIYTRYLKFTFTKSGYKVKHIRAYIDGDSEPIDFNNVVMKSRRFIEQRSIG